jgi:hypothetical protein
MSFIRILLNARPYIVLCFWLFVVPVTLVQCTSSDENTTLLDQELGDLDTGNDGMIEDLDGLDDFIDDGALADLGDDDSFGEDDLGGEVDGMDGLDDELAELDELNDSFDGDFDDVGDDAFADAGDGFDEFDDFDDFDDFGEGGDAFAQNEQSLEDELNQSQSFDDYPVMENAQATFPEEVVGADGLPVAPIAGGDSTITSESSDFVAIGDPLDGSLDNSLPQDDLGMADPLIDDDQPEPQTWVPVVKIKTDPFFRNQRLMNAVYIARPKDNFESINGKIFGSEDRVSQLKADNPHLDKGIDPGDKIYYNSPSRVDDKTQLKFYYEDIGLKPQYYTTRSGDNIRRLGLKLLGFPDGWKEVWAINQQVDSKTILPEGLELKYWTGDEPSAQVPVAVNEVADEEDQMMATTGTMDDPFAGADFPEEPELPVEPPLPDAGLAMGGQLEPEILPDIEPFPEEVIQPSQMASVDQQDSLLSIGALALLLMAGVALVAIQIKKRKDSTGISPQSLEYTQV